MLRNPSACNTPDTAFVRALGNVFLTELQKPDAAPVWKTLAASVAVWAACGPTEATAYLGESANE